MLVLGRKENQDIYIGDNIRIVVVKITDTRVELGIDAPREITVNRGEIHKLLQGGKPIDKELNNVG